MKKAIIEVIKELNPREAVSGKEYPEFKKGIVSVLNTCYKVYQARENGTITKEAESEAMTEVTAFLHTLGKANGKYISVCEKTTENGVASVLFDTLVYHSFQDRIYTTSQDLAQAENEKAKASKAVKEAHEKFLASKATAKEYKEAVAKYDEAVQKVTNLRKQKGKENTLTEKASVGKFTKFATARLKAIIENRYALSKEEAEALRKIRNKETKAKRNEAKPNGKKPEAVAKKPEAKTEAVKKTA